MVVAIWNMAKRPAAWGHLLEALAPDVALLQETPRPPDLSRVAQLVHDPGYASNSLGSAVYVRDGGARQLELPPKRRLWFAAAEVKLQGASPLVAVSVHTPTVPSVRPFIDEAFEELSLLLEGRSFIVGADFNLSRNYDKVYGTTHHTELLDGLPARGFVDCMRQAFGDEQRTFWGRTKYAYQNDHVFVSEDLASSVVTCEVADRGGVSDHSPLRLTLEAAEAD